MSSTSAVSGLRYTSPVINPAILEAVSSMAKLQEQLRLFDSSWIKQAQVLQAALSPMSEYMIRMEPLMSGLKSAMTIRQQEISAIGAALAEPLSRMQQHMETFNKVNSLAISKLVTTFASAQTEWLKTSAAFVSSYRPVISTLGSLDAEITPLLKALSSIKLNLPANINMVALQNLSRSIASSEYSPDDIEIDEDGTMTITGETLSIATVKEALITNLRDSGLLDVIRRMDENVTRLEQSYSRQSGRILAIEEAVNNMVRLVSEMKESKIKMFLQGLILALLFNFISNNFVTPLTQPFTDIPVKAIVKLYRKDAKVATASIDHEALKQFKFVTMPALKVRAGGRMKSHIVAEAKLGQVVTVVRKDRNWTLVEYIDRHTEDFISGWVLTRYIESFK